jgi:GAF domain-containing protein
LQEQEDSMAEADDLQDAQQRISDLEAEVQRLQRRVDDERTLEDLRVRLAQVGAAGALSAPTEHRELLEQLVQTAMHVLDARAGSLYLIDEERNELIFEVAQGERATSLVGQRLPLGQGLAGFVAATGQSIAVADVQKDPRWGRHVAEAVGYQPRSMLAMPLMLRDRVTGVLQLLDRSGGEAFTAGDMATLSLFAQQAAVAIALSRNLSSLSTLLVSLLSSKDQGDQEDTLAQRAATLAAGAEESAEYRDTMELAALLGQIARRGDSARRLALGVAREITQYLQSQPRYG